MKITIEITDIGILHIIGSNEKKLSTFGASGKISVVENEDILYTEFLNIAKRFFISKTDMFKTYEISENNGASK